MKKLTDEALLELLELAKEEYRLNPTDSGFLGTVEAMTELAEIRGILE